MKTIFSSMEISASGMTAQRLRLNAIASNIANAETTRTEDGGPYRRQIAHLVEDSDKPIFTPLPGSLFTKEMLLAISHKNHMPNDTDPYSDKIEDGVKVLGIIEDETSDFKTMYDPDHPDADEFGYVKMPNVDVVKEMVDMISASRAYEANSSVLQASKDMINKALELGRV